MAATMCEERSHGQYVPRTTQDQLNVARHTFDGLARSVRSELHTQGPVLLGDVIQENTEGQHSLEQFDRRFDVRHARLFRRMDKGIAWQSVIHDRNGHVFVPGQDPTLSRRLIEIKCTHQTESISQYTSQEIKNGRHLPHCRCGRHPIQNISRGDHSAVSASDGARFIAIVRKARRDFGPHSFKLFLCKDRWHRHETILFNRLNPR